MHMARCPDVPRRTHLKLGIVAVGVAVSHDVSHFIRVLGDGSKVVVDAAAAELLHQVRNLVACTTCFELILR